MVVTTSGGSWMGGELEPFVKRLVDYFDGDVTIILFGSRARGACTTTGSMALAKKKFEEMKKKGLRRERYWVMRAWSPDPLAIYLPSFSPSSRQVFRASLPARSA